MIRLLTLAMTEIKPGEETYKIIALWIERKKIITLNLKESRFIDINGNPVWDIFGVTQVEDIRETNNSNQYTVIGDRNLEEYVNKNETKEIFYDKNFKLSTFIRDKSLEFCVSRARSIYDIQNGYEKDYNGNSTFSSRATISDGSKEIKNIKIKDYRWLKYWKSIIDRNIVNEKNLEDTYEEFFCKKEIYLILFRYKPVNGKSKSDIRWIAGIHYF